MECVQLEAYIASKIEEAQASDSAHGHPLRADRIMRLSREDIERYQLLQLKKAVNYAYACSSFYRAAFDAQRIRPEALKSLEDLTCLPFTEPSDVVRNPSVFGSAGRVRKTRSSHD